MTTSPTPDDDDLEAVIRDLIERKNQAVEDSPEYLFVMRQLAGLRYSREEAGPIMEDLDPFGWGATQPLPSRPPLAEPTAPVALVRRAGSRPEPDPA